MLRYLGVKCHDVCNFQNAKQNNSVCVYMRVRVCVCVFGEAGRETKRKERKQGRREGGRKIIFQKANNC